MGWLAIISSIMALLASPQFAGFVQWIISKLFTKAANKLAPLNAVTIEDVSNAVHELCGKVIADLPKYAYGRRALVRAVQRLALTYLPDVASSAKSYGTGALNKYSMPPLEAEEVEEILDLVSACETELLG
jgi:hypothetical protein